MELRSRKQTTALIHNTEEDIETASQSGTDAMESQDMKKLKLSRIGLRSKITRVSRLLQDLLGTNASKTTLKENLATLKKTLGSMEQQGAIASASTIGLWSVNGTPVSTAPTLSAA